ncbi:M20 family metallopeptidase [Siccirubricoccus sp. KC 17139]|uniref:M20 family metallopeptidase n=1 Tax=Siccirubricoccus soli TaxID=2899147 RepID=A0ABT1DA74_9PROT|nr:M20 family metallopeptidase [Siccirubricoccus soli]MCO6418502.1 M20 family metallopeptidase [Siccirubricoccus soli]MCP2684637.1 M20 family metallopeptidase [Siccirubricoccus soli]
MTADAPDSAITAWLATQQEAMLKVLEEMVNTDGGSYDKPGVDAVGAIVQRFMAEHGIPVEVVQREKYGDCLKARVEGDNALASGNQQQHIVLMGHRDTVFPKGEPTRRPFTVKDGIAYGPGVADMKAGLVMNMFVLAAFKKFGGAPGPLLGLFTGDEEIGSPEGREVIEAAAREARVVFNSEPGRPNGGVVTGRKGGVFSIFEIEGKAAHSGGNFEAGISAIEELARKIQAIHALTDLQRGITLNVGLVSGGQSVNTVAPWAQGQIDLRYVEPADRDEVMTKIEAIIAKSFVPGTKAKLTIRGEFLPLTQSPAAAKLFEMYRGAASESGLAITGEFSGGCADSGFTAAVGAPTICAVGPVGGKAHSPEEYLEVASLVPRAQAAARAILRLEQAGL